MKTCPKCHAEYEDKMSFCLQDGTPLVHLEDAGDADEPEQVTVVRRDTTPDESAAKTEEWQGKPFTDEEIEASQPQESTIDEEPVASGEEIESKENKKSYLGLIIGLLSLVFLLFFGTVIGSGLWWYFQNRPGDDIASANTNQEVNTNIDNTGDQSNTDSNLENANVEDPDANSNTNENADLKPEATPKKEEKEGNTDPDADSKTDEDKDSENTDSETYRYKNSNSEANPDPDSKTHEDKDSETDSEAYKNTEPDFRRHSKRKSN